MYSRLWIRFLVLLVAVVVIGLSVAFLLREHMVQDFRAHLQSEMEDRVLWLAASLESSYATHKGWEAQDVIDTIVWAAMMGIDIRIHNAKGELISDTEAAFNSLSPPVRQRVQTFYGERMQDAGGDYMPYELVVGGERFGGLDARVLPPKKEAVFLERSNRFLLNSVLVMGGIAIVLSIIFSMRLTAPIGELTDAASRIAEGDLMTRVNTTRKDELGTLSTTFNTMAERLVTQDRLRKKLTANIAHELRTPISAARGELEGMIDGLIPTQKDTLQSLYDEMGRLKTILDGIEDLSHAEASSLDIQWREFDISTFLRNIIERYEKGFADKKVILRLECLEGLMAKADPDKLSQVLINLLSNALKATSEGDNVLVKAALEGDELVLSCTDAGMGITKEDLSFIFERFYRGTKGGLGLGLTISRELIEAHGGEIFVRSRQGEGTTFFIQIPQ
jgi:two-component system sensor histidine kinase BaeS